MNSSDLTVPSLLIAFSSCSKIQVPASTLLESAQVMLLASTTEVTAISGDNWNNFHGSFKRRKVSFSHPPPRHTHSQGLRTICWECLAFADLHRPLFSCLQNWGRWEPGRKTAVYSLPRYLGREGREGRYPAPVPVKQHFCTERQDRRTLKRTEIF